MQKINAAIIGLGFVGASAPGCLAALVFRSRGCWAARRSAPKLRGMRWDCRERTLRSRNSPRIPPFRSCICARQTMNISRRPASPPRGKNVLCEKPLTLDSRESAALVSLAKETGRVGGVAYNLRYYPLCHEARALIRKGAIGQVRLVHGSFLQDWLLFPTDWNWRLSKVGRRTARRLRHWHALARPGDLAHHSKVSELCADLATVLPTRRKPKGRVETFQKVARQRPRKC